MYVMHFLQFWTIKTVDVTHGSCEKKLDVQTSLTISHVLLPNAMYFGTSRSASHAMLAAVDRHMSQSEVYISHVY